MARSTEWVINIEDVWRDWRHWVQFMVMMGRRERKIKAVRIKGQRGKGKIEIKVKD